MGFYLKKGFNFGPFRLNVSKSGIGVSVGSKGLRFGSGPRGNYVHAGRNGLYYRKAVSFKTWLVLIIIFGLGYGIYFALSRGIITVNL